MYHLTQYIVVRRDLPLEAIMPQACHASGKAMFAYCAKLAVVHPEARWDTLVTDWGHPTRIIKGARNEAKLLKLTEKLSAAGVDYSTIIEPVEPDGVSEGNLLFRGQMTALSLFPGEKDKLSPLLNDFQNLRWENVPAFVAAMAQSK